MTEKSTSPDVTERDVDSETYRSRIHDILATVERPGKFVANGDFQTFPPTLAVEGYGTVSLPLRDENLARLVELADLAPFGRGEKTLVDQNVRNTWQIDASSIQCLDPEWNVNLSKILQEVARQFGIEEVVSAELYKLLLYESGGFFKQHRDTEKSDGMFATLVIVLPSEFEGGEVVVEHDGETVTRPY